MNFTESTLAELSRYLSEEKITSRALTDAFIKKIETSDGEINAFVTKTFDTAREQADASDARRKLGKIRGKLDGIPITLKDVVCSEGIRTTASSNMLKEFIPPYSATVWQRLEKAGCILLGKVNTDEFTMGVSTESSAFGVTKNPHDLTRVSGGSSGGSAASVAANMCAGSVATDTGGSIRQPAGFCGVTGLKVSYGRVSRFGVLPMASSLDTIGPIAKTAQDCAMLLEVMAGKDPKDATSQAEEDLDFTSNLKNSISGMRIGIPDEYFIDGIDETTANIVYGAKEVLKSLGAEIVNISLPHTKYSVPAYYVIAPAEISSNMARYDGVRFGSGKKISSTSSEQAAENLNEIYQQTRSEGFGDEVQRRILLGTFVLSAGYADQFYKQAQKVRTLIKQDFDQAFEKVDAILTPVSPNPAFKVGEKVSDPVKMYLEDIFTAPASLAGISGISVPFGKSAENLPIGIQLLGPQLGEAKILQIAHQLQVNR